MLAHGQDDFNANNFLIKRQKSKNFLIQITNYHRTFKNMILKKCIMITVR